MHKFDINSAIVPVSKAKAVLAVKKPKAVKMTKYLAFWNAATALFESNPEKEIELDLLALTAENEKTGEIVPLCEPTENRSAGDTAYANFNAKVMDYRKNNPAAKLSLIIGPSDSEDFKKDENGYVAVLAWNPSPTEVTSA